MSESKLLLKMKCALLHYFKNKRKGIVAPDVRCINIDEVLAQVNQQYIEVGIVETLIELQADLFRSKFENIDFLNSPCPQMFFFCLPISLLTDKNIEKIYDMYSDRYGILGFDDSRKDWDDKIVMIKRAEVLNKNDSSNILAHLISARAVSELVQMYKSLVE